MLQKCTEKSRKNSFNTSSRTAESNSFNSFDSSGRNVEQGRLGLTVLTGLSRKCRTEHKVQNSPEEHFPHFLQFYNFDETGSQFCAETWTRQVSDRKIGARGAGINSRKEGK